jgi:hypothetical protein
MMCYHQRREQDVSYWRTLKEILTRFLRSPRLLFLAMLPMACLTFLDMETFFMIKLGFALML